jgi:hypothetical protein
METLIPRSSFHNHTADKAKVSWWAAEQWTIQWDSGAVRLLVSDNDRNTKYKFTPIYPFSLISAFPQYRKVEGIATKWQKKIAINQPILILSITIENKMEDYQQESGISFKTGNWWANR